MGPTTVNTLATAGNGAKTAALGGSPLLKALIQSHVVKGLGMGVGMGTGLAVWMAGAAALGGGYLMWKKSRQTAD